MYTVHGRIIETYCKAASVVKLELLVLYSLRCTTPLLISSLRTSMIHNLFLLYFYSVLLANTDLLLKLSKRRQVVAFLKVVQ